jgi:DNA-binding MarR family transcriptional regulator
MAIHITLTPMATLQDDFNSCLFHSTSALYRQLEKLAQTHFKAVKLSPTQGFILMTLKKYPSISIGDLAAVHQLDQSTITRVVDKLVSLGLVVREPFGSTTRSFLTDLGLEKVADAVMAWEKLQHAYDRVLGHERSRDLASQVTSAVHELVS